MIIFRKFFLPIQSRRTAQKSGEWASISVVGIICSPGWNTVNCSANFPPPLSGVSDFIKEFYITVLLNRKTWQINCWTKGTLWKSLTCKWILLSYPIRFVALQIFIPNYLTSVFFWNQNIEKYPTVHFSSSVPLAAPESGPKVPKEMP